jgi:protein required for attachment to host cells
MNWIIVANSGTARILRGNNALDQLDLVQELEHPAGRRRNSELVSDRQGSTRGGSLGASAGLSARTEPSRVEARRFASELADVIRDGSASYERVVLVAPPTFLGDLRSALHPTTAKLVVASIAKDFTHMPLHALPEVVKKGMDAALHG